MFGTSHGAIDARLVRFSSLYDLCSGYTEGMGYYCSPDRTLATQPPVWPLYGNFLYVRHYCNICCWCEDLEPDVEDTVTGTSAVSDMEREGCENESESSGAIVANECADSAANPLRTDNVACSPVMYGHPPDSDCEQAIAAITANIEEPLQVREFLGISGMAPQYSNYQKVQTPQSFTVRQCTVSVVVLEGRYDNTDLESWDYIAKRASAIRSTCVQGSLHCGGWTKAGLVSGSIGVFVHGPNSKFEAFLAAHYACMPNREGIMECESQSPQRYKRPPDTGANNDRPSKVCGSPGNPCNQPFPDMAAVAVAALNFITNCRGRCLIDGNDTVEIAATPTNTSSTADLAGMTCPCNCTYVSEACCLSTTGIVFEDPIKKINTTLQAPNSSVCCDHQTGQWANAASPRGPTQLDPAC